MDTTQQVAPPKKKGSGCRTGCLVILVIFLLSFGAVLFIINRSVSSIVQTITTTTPVEVQVVELDSAVATKAGEKYQQLVDGLNAGKAVDLQFTASEINNLIAGHPDFKIWRGKLFAELNGENADLRFNFPLGMITDAVPSLKLLGFDVTGRHINGRVIGTVSLKGDELLIKLSQLEFNGERAGAEVIREINSGLAKKRVLDPKGHESEKLLAQIDTLTVQGGELVVRTKGSVLSESMPPPSHDPSATAVAKNLGVKNQKVSSTAIKVMPNA